MRRYICLGFNVDKKIGYVTGLAVMHDLFISILKEEGCNVKSISLNPRKGFSTKIGEKGLRRLLDYFTIIGCVVISFIKERRAVFYFNPSTTTAGLYRDVLLVMLAKMFGHKVLMQQFGALFENFKRSLNVVEDKLLVWSYNKADLIIVEGAYARRQYSFINSQEKIKVIPNGLPNCVQNRENLSKTYDKIDCFNLFFMNNMIESKGYRDVLKAVDLLINKRKKNISCVFAGKFLTSQDDEYSHSVEEAVMWFDKFVSEHNLSERVSYYESVFDEEKQHLFQKAHAFLLPSYYMFEGQPTAIIEALSYGCVPIVTRYRLIPDMVNESCGIFVERKSPDSIADAVESLMDNPNLYGKFSKEGFSVFQARFTREIYSKKILNAISLL